MSTIYLAREDRKFIRPELNGVPSTAQIEFRLGDAGEWKPVQTIAGSPRILVRGPGFVGENGDASGELITADRTPVYLRVTDTPERLSALFGHVELLD